MSELREVHVRIIPDLTQLTKAIEAAAAHITTVNASIRRASEQMQRHLQIAFADSEKDRRRLRRDYARANRRPALIHNGRKP